MRRIIVAVAAVLIANSAQAQQSPQSVLDGLIRQQQEQNAISRQNERDRLEIERLDLQDQLRYRRMDDRAVWNELDRYCAGGTPPCNHQPPQMLLQEAARWGIIQFQNRQNSLGRDCIIMGDALGGGIGDCQ